MHKDRLLERTGAGAVVCILCLMSLERVLLETLKRSKHYINRTPKSMAPEGQSVVHALGDEETKAIIYFLFSEILYICVTGALGRMRRGLTVKGAFKRGS